VLTVIHSSAVPRWPAPASRSACGLCRYHCLLRCHPHGVGDPDQIAPASSRLPTRWEPHPSPPLVLKPYK
jgi:hypothetical protein